jgi:DUF971 family protein
MHLFAILSYVNQARANHKEAEVKSNEINVISVTQIGKYQLRLCFDDGTVQDIDFGQFLSQSQQPDIRAYLEEARFNAYRLEHGEVVWGDYDPCFPIDDLHSNQIEKHASLQAVA